jgi:integrase
LTEDLRRIVRKLRVERPGGCRDRAVLLVGFGAAMRRSELIALDLDDITITQAGLTILVRRSKTDQEGQGREIGIPRSRKSAPARWRRSKPGSISQSHLSIRPIRMTGNEMRTRMGMIPVLYRSSPGSTTAGSPPTG